MPALDGVRVVDLTRLLPGAYATKLLVDRGAEVIKIEDPRGGDTMRTLGAAYFDALNHGKKSVTLDLRSPDASPILDALLATADVLVESFRPSTAARLRVDPDRLRRTHPRLICASMIGFPRKSPRAEHPAHDINYQALAGLLARGSMGSPRADEGPIMPGPLVADIGAAMQTAIAILAALMERQRTGVGVAFDVPLSDAAREWARWPLTADFASACYTLYETADGAWLALGALEEKFWRAFCDRLGRPDFIPLQHARQFDEIRRVMRSRTCNDWLAWFDGIDTCLTPVVERPAADSHGTAPALGADTDDLLDALGVSSDARTRLRERGVIC